MNTRFASVWLRLKLPVLVLGTLLQRTPAVRILTFVEDVITVSPVGAVIRSAAATAASLGAMHSLAGATTLVPTAASPYNATVGTALPGIGFTVTNTVNIAQWRLGGSLPPGLKLQSADGSKEITGPGTLDATMPGVTDSYGEVQGGTFNTVPLLTGTPTQPGNYTITLQAVQGTLGYVSSVFSYRINVAASAQPSGPPTVSTQPLSQTAAAGGSATLSVAASGSPTFAWQRNGTAVAGATSASLTLSNLQPANTGIYQAQVTSTGGTTASRAAIVGVNSTVKIVGTGQEFADIFHSGTGFTYDQILLGGAAASVTADPGQILRMSFVDLNDDIVQVEFSGAGTLSLVLDNPTGPAAPAKYNQATTYMKGHAGIVLTGANETTNLSVFSVGKANATNQALFRSDVTYDGFADIAFIAITSTDGKFGGLRAANASCFAAKGYTGLYAPGVEFTGPVFLNDINASDTATPVLMIGSGNDVRITGGDLQQTNTKVVQVSGFTQLKFTAGSTSHGTVYAAQTNKGRLEKDGADVTTATVVNP
jgi:hypothetical protein